MKKNELELSITRLEAQCALHQRVIAFLCVSSLPRSVVREFLGNLHIPASKRSSDAEQIVDDVLSGFRRDVLELLLRAED